MRKTIVGLVSFVLACVLAGCGIPGGQTGGNPGPSGGATRAPDGFPYDDDYIASHMKTEWSITYRYESVDANGSSSDDRTYTRTPEGVYWMWNGGEGLYIVAGDTGKYYKYAGSAADGFHRASDELFDEATVYAAGGHAAYSMRQYATMSDKLAFVGTQSIIGRKVDQYDQSGPATGSSGKYTFWIDKETGVCLQMTWTKMLNGVFMSNKFTVVEFKNGGVTLPKHD